MVADERGQLRWATASDQPTQIIEEGEERLGQGPCVNTFIEHAPIAMRDAAKGAALGCDHRRGHRPGDAGRAECAGAAGGARSAPWTCTRRSPGTGIRSRLAPPGVCGPSRDAAQSGGRCSGQRVAGRAVADGVCPPDPDRAGQGDGDAAGGDRRRDRVCAAAECGPVLSAAADRGGRRGAGRPAALPPAKVTPPG
jgi:hypothetical protein